MHRKLSIWQYFGTGHDENSVRIVASLFHLMSIGLSCVAVQTGTTTGTTTQVRRPHRVTSQPASASRRPAQHRLHFNTGLVAGRTSPIRTYQSHWTGNFTLYSTGCPWMLLAWRSWRLSLIACVWIASMLRRLPTRGEWLNVWRPHEGQGLTYFDVWAHRDTWPCGRYIIRIYASSVIFWYWIFYTGIGFTGCSFHLFNIFYVGSVRNINNLLKWQCCFPKQTFDTRGIPRSNVLQCLRTKIEITVITVLLGVNSKLWSLPYAHVYPLPQCCFGASPEHWDNIHIPTRSVFDEKHWIPIENDSRGCQFSGVLFISVRLYKCAAPWRMCQTVCWDGMTSRLRPGNGHHFADDICKRIFL